MTQHEADKLPEAPSYAPMSLSVSQAEFVHAGHERLGPGAEATDRSVADRGTGNRKRDVLDKKRCGREAVEGGVSFSAGLSGTSVLCARTAKSQRNKI